MTIDGPKGVLVMTGINIGIISVVRVIVHKTLQTIKIAAYSIMRIIELLLGSFGSLSLESLSILSCSRFVRRIAIREFRAFGPRKPCRVFSHLDFEI